MKNLRISLLIIATLAVFSFTVGLFIGRNHSGGDVTLSFPDEMKQVPTASTEAQSGGFISTGPVVSPIDINAASYEELLQLPGVGEGLALEIISYRAANGEFAHVEELMDVPGIGESRMEALLDFITVGGNP